MYNGGGGMKPAERAREIRLGQGISLTYVAREIGISVSLWGNVEQGRRPFRIEYVEPLARVLHVSPLEFLTESKQNV